MYFFSVLCTYEAFFFPPKIRYQIIGPATRLQFVLALEWEQLILSKVFTLIIYHERQGSYKTAMHKTVMSLV